MLVRRYLHCQALKAKPSVIGSFVDECPKLYVDTTCLNNNGQFSVFCLSIDVKMFGADCHQNARVTLSAAAAEGRRMCRGQD